MRLDKIWLWVVVFLFIALAVLWRWSPLHDRLSLSALDRWGNILQHHRWTLLWVLLGYTMGGLVSFPHSLLIWATAFTFPTGTAIFYSELGTVCSGSAVYVVGRRVNRNVAERLVGPRLESLRAGFAKQAVLSIILLHIFPIMPFSVLNVVASISGVRFRDFMVGTVLGVTPGILIVCLLGNRVLRILHHPNGKDILLFVLFVVVGLLVLATLKRHLARRSHSNT